MKSVTAVHLRVIPVRTLNAVMVPLVSSRMEPDVRILMANVVKIVN